MKEGDVMGKLTVHTDEIAAYLQSMHEHYEGQEDTIKDHITIFDEIYELLAPQDLNAISNELEDVKEKANDYVNKKMAFLHDILSPVKPIKPYEEAMSHIRQFMKDHNISEINRMVREIKPVNRTTKTVDGVTIEDVIQEAGEITGAHDLYRAFGGKDPVTGEELNFTEWLESVGWSILTVVPPAAVVKGAGKTGKAAKGAFAIKGVKRANPKEQLTQLGELSKVSARTARGKGKQLTERELSRIQQQMVHYIDYFGYQPNVAFADVGLGISARSPHLANKSEQIYPISDGSKTGVAKGGKGRGKLDPAAARAKQRSVIDSVESGKVQLKTNKQKGNYGEMKMDDYFESQGYTRISRDRVTSLDDKIMKGIDGVYENANPPPKYVIAEAKYGASQLGNTKSGRQMSDEWLKTRRRLENAVGQTKADEIQMEILLNPNNVEKHLIKVEGNGNIVKSKLSTHGYRMK